jgi:hypothetical protein
MYSECVSLALGSQHEMRMRRIILSYVVCSAVPYFPHYLINGTILGEKFIIIIIIINIQD